MPNTKTTKKFSISKAELLSLVNSTPGRLLAFVVVVMLVVGIALLKTSLFPDPYSGADSAASTFFKAFENCNLSVAQEYYLPLQNNSSEAQQYVKTCQMGEFNFSYVNRQSASQTRKKGVETKAVSFVYNYSNTKGSPGQILVELVWTSQLNHWYIYSLTPNNVSSSTSSNSLP